MSYTKLFDPAVAPAEQRIATVPADRLGDRRDTPVAGQLYRYSDDIVLAVNVALAAGRPLLVRGDPGIGKSSLARAVATALGWRYYATTVSSRTTARDLQWSYDTVARLADAQAGRKFVRPRSAYRTPGVLWWAFDADSAARRGVAPPAFEEAVRKGLEAAVDPGVHFADPPQGSEARAVVLIDEIDKADPDVPNDLLLPLGSFQFSVDDEKEPVVATVPPLVVLTTNEERDLPKAFLRRCVVLALKQPTRTGLTAIAKLHFPKLGDAELEPLVDAYRQVRGDRATAGENLPSVAEFLDAVAAYEKLGTTSTTPEWPDLVALLLAKPGAPTGAPDPADETLAEVGSAAP